MRVITFLAFLVILFTTISGADVRVRDGATVCMILGMAGSISDIIETKRKARRR